MLSYGAVAIAVVDRQIKVIQAARPHDHNDNLLDVYTFDSARDGLFTASEAPCARISSRDVLFVFPTTDAFSFPAHHSISLPPAAYEYYLKLSERTMAKLAYATYKRRQQGLWSAWRSRFAECPS